MPETTHRPCEGADHPEPAKTRAYRVEWMDGSPASVAWYCDECADLAHANVTGEIAGITPRT